MKFLPDSYCPYIGCARSVSKRCCKRELMPCVHVTLIVVFKYNHIVIPEGGSECRSKPYIKPSVPCNHDKCYILILRYLTPPLSLLIHFYNSAKCSGTILKQIVYICNIKG